MRVGKRLLNVGRRVDSSPLIFKTKEFVMLRVCVKGVTVERVVQFKRNEALPLFDLSTFIKYKIKYKS